MTIFNFFFHFTGLKIFCFWFWFLPSEPFKIISFIPHCSLAKPDKKASVPLLRHNRTDLEDSFELFIHSCCSQYFVTTSVRTNTEGWSWKLWKNLPVNFVRYSFETHSMIVSPLRLKQIIIVITLNLNTFLS